MGFLVNMYSPEIIPYKECVDNHAVFIFTVCISCISIVVNYLLNQIWYGRHKSCL